MSISVVTLGPGTWDLVDRLERLHGDVTVVRRCLDLSELIACAHTGMAHAALVAEGAEDLTASLLGQLADAGLRVLVVEGHDAARPALGVARVPAAATGAEVAELIRETLRSPEPGHRAAPGSRRGTGTGTSTGDSDDRTAARGATPSAGAAPQGPAALGRTGPFEGAASSAGDIPVPEDATGGAAGAAFGDGGADSTTDVVRDGDARGAAEPPDRDTGRNAAGNGSGSGTEGTWAPDAHDDAALTDPEDATVRVVAVWGPTGAPGRTVTALNLAAEAALAGRRVLLVDADTYGASVAASLGMLDEAAGIAQACRLADQGRLDVAGLRRCATAVSVAGASVDVLTGITRHDRWPELRGSALDIVFDRAREGYGLVVVDTAFGLEADEEITTDFLAPRRNAGTLSAVAAADTVVAVAAADALGVPRMVKALPDLEEAAPDARVVVVANKLRAAAAGHSAAASVAEAWERFSPGHRIAHTLAWDPSACDDALLAGAVLAETAPRSELRRQFTELARTVLGGGRVPQPEPTVRLAAGTRLGRRMGAWLRRG